MTAEQANSTGIKHYLSARHIFPVKEKEHYGMYRSPFRSDANPSFKVDYRRNLWIDFGTGEGGTMVDLVMKILQCSFAEAIQKIADHRFPASFFFHGKESFTESNIRITKVLPLAGGALIGYLAERKINLDTAREQCREVHYTVNGKAYFAVGFANDAGGYELRNRYFKGCTSPKDITVINKGTDTCVIFEGFTDYLSYLSLKHQTNPKTDIVVLNSVILLNRAADFLKRHIAIHVCMDNDEAGKQATGKIRNLCDNVIDCSGYYKNHKDLNDFLCEKSGTKQSVNIRSGEIVDGQANQSTCRASDEQPASTCQAFKEQTISKQQAM